MATFSNRLLLLLSVAVIAWVLGIWHGARDQRVAMAFSAAKSVVSNWLLDPKQQSWWRTATVIVAQGILPDDMLVLQPDSWWQPVSKSASSGVVQHDSARSQKGYTLYTSGHGQAARLIDMQGREVHRWALDFLHAWPEPSHISDLVPKGNIHWETVHVLPNGDLLAIYIGHGSTPYGYGLVRLDKDSRLLWRYDGHAHHDIDVGPDGTIYTLGQRVRETPLLARTSITPPFLDDSVVLLSPDGKVLKEVSIADAFARSPYADLLNLALPNHRGDLLHANQAEYIGAADAAHLPGVEAGHVLLSLREISTIAALDPERGIISWALRGPWLFQHDPDILANGNILIFDNRGNFGPGGPSRILEVDPRTSDIVWRYTGNGKAPLYSRVRSDAQRLANGNTLITESEQGRIIEVTPDGGVVWAFLNPARRDSKYRGADAEIAAIGLDTIRLTPEQLPFLKLPN